MRQHCSRNVDVSCVIDEHEGVHGVVAGCGGHRVEGCLVEGALVVLSCHLEHVGAVATPGAGLALCWSEVS